MRLLFDVFVYTIRALAWVGVVSTSSRLIPASGLSTTSLTEWQMTPTQPSGETIGVSK